MITIWGRASSTNVQKVLWTLDELGLPYERVDCGREYGGLDTVEFRAMNPNGRIPVMKDGDVILWESNTICRYLCRTRNGTGLYPDEPQRSAEVEKWMDWQIATLWPSMRPMFFAAREHHDISVAHDEKFAATTASARRNVRILNETLAERPYLAGAEFTLADMPSIISINRWLFIGFNLDEAAHVEDWYKRAIKRPASAENVKASF
ncbi:MAG: glutathione S-transferase family protein [Hyphomicrobiales bacterium]